MRKNQDVKRISSLIGLIALGIFLGMVIGPQSCMPDFTPKKVVKEEGQALLEKVESVFKMVNIEGAFSDVYSYEDFYQFDLSPFRKKALLKVKAKVAVGYDLTETKFTLDHGKKKLIIENYPEPSILYIEPTINYYDITEGTFNSFSAKELTELNEKASRHIRKQAETSDLKDKAKEQGNEFLLFLQEAATANGWTIEMHDGLLPKVEELKN